MKRLRRRTHRTYDLQGGQRHLDPARGRFILVTDEEGVRQDVVAALLDDYGYPLSAIRTEELVARGTANRDRADVLVELPRRPAHIEVVEASSIANEERASYGRLREQVRALIDPGVATLVDIPDVVRLKVAERDVEAKVRGFQRAPAGHVLVAETPASLIAAGYPRELFVQVNGYGPRADESALARQLGIDPCEWTHDAVIALYGGVDGSSGEEADVARTLSWTTLTDEKAAWTLFFGEGSDEYGVLAKLNLDYDGGSEPPPVATPHIPERPRGERAGANVTAIVIECKAPSVPLTDEVLSQGLRYARERAAPFVVVTNGSDARSYHLTSDGHATQIDDLPSYDEIVRDDRVRVSRVAAAGTNLEIPEDLDADRAWWHTRARPWQFGFMIDAEYRVPLLRLDAVLFDERRLYASPSQTAGVTFVDDLGNREHAPGSPAGSWPGVYRDFLVRDEDGEFVVGFAMLSSCLIPWKGALTKTVVSPLATTYVICAVANGAIMESAVRSTFRSMVDSATASSSLRTTAR